MVYDPDGSQRTCDYCDYKDTPVTLTLRKWIRLDCVEEGPDKRGQPWLHDAPVRYVLVLGLAEVLGDYSWWTGSIGRGRLEQAEQQQQQQRRQRRAQSKAGHESSSVALPTPARTQPHACTWDQLGNSGSSRSTKSVLETRHIKKNVMTHMMQQKRRIHPPAPTPPGFFLLSFFGCLICSAHSKWKKTECHSGVFISGQPERKRLVLLLSGFSCASRKVLACQDKLIPGTWRVIPESLTPCFWNKDRATVSSDTFITPVYPHWRSNFNNFHTSLDRSWISAS